jgi:iron complex transport system ATP-binding protein
MLEIRDLVFKYNGAQILGAVWAVVEKGCMVSVVGPNGTGKTTLIKCIAGILKPAAGQILIDGSASADFTRRELARRIGYVPQHTQVRLPMTVFETVLAGRRPHQAWRPGRKDIQCTAAILHRMDLGDLAMRDMDQLSGGQAQKALLARALAQESDYLLLDEPTSSLDLRHQLEVLELIAGLVKTKRKGALMAMHDLNLAARFSDTVLMMKAGNVFCKGDPLDVIIPENIHNVYDVEAVVHRNNGYPYIQPICCSSERKDFG